MKRVLLVLVPALAHAEVKLDDAAQAIATAAAKLELKHATFGETLTLDTIAPLDPAKPVNTAQLRAALAKYKLKTVDDTTRGNATVITVEASNGVRATISVDQGGGAITLTARPANPTLPGKCVAIPQEKHPVYVNTSGVNQQGERHDGKIFWDYKTERLHDLDGDGILDAFVPVAKSKDACPEDVSWRVYIVRGSCGHDLGVIGPGSLPTDTSTTAIDASGFRPVTASSETTRVGKGHIPVMTTTTRRFAVKGGKYAGLGGKKQTGVCHHCATWTCKAP